MRRLLGLAAIAAAVTYFFNPQEGARRRAEARDRIAGFFRRGVREGEQLGRSVSAQAEGLAEQATELQEEPQPDDVTLTQKVESEIFRDVDVPKGQINVNAENGKIYLRGEVGKPELIEDLEQRARKVQGVQDVENLLHLPGAEAPSKT
ncbi:MAG: BON domain-containing protein [Gaiellaceae bacterium]